MTNDLQQRRVVLIFGNPENGKSYLANQLHVNYGYHLVRLDRVYVEFVQTRYPILYLPALNQVIAQHYNMILVPCDRAGIAPRAVAAWRDHVASLAEEVSRQSHLVAIEGYLLAPVLDAVQERLTGTAVVTTVEAHQWRYLVAGMAKTIEQIHGGNDAA